MLCLTLTQRRLFNHGPEVLWFSLITAWPFTESSAVVNHGANLRKESDSAPADLFGVPRAPHWWTGSFPACPPLGDLTEGATFHPVKGQWSYWPTFLSLPLPLSLTFCVLMLTQLEILSNNVTWTEQNHYRRADVVYDCPNCLLDNLRRTQNQSRLKAIVSWVKGSMKYSVLRSRLSQIAPHLSHLN